MFVAQTSYAGKLKALFEVLFSNMSTVCLTIDARGIRSEILTNHNMLICVDLPAECFDEYSFEFDEPQYIGLGSHVNHFFKSLKNKTVVKFTIDKPFVLDIEIKYTVEDYVISYSSNIESMQNIASCPIETYDCEGIAISSSNFNQMCKSFRTTLIDVTKRDGQLLFSFEIAGISSKKLEFGKKQPEDTSLYFNTFKSDYFVRIGKLASFVTEPIKIYAERSPDGEDKKLMIEAISSIGTVRIFMDSVKE